MVANKFLEDIELKDDIRKEYEFISQETYEAKVCSPAPRAPSVLDWETVLMNGQS